MAWALAALVLLLAAALLIAHRYARAMRVERLRSVEQQQRAELLVRATQAGLFEWVADADRTTYSDRLKEMLGHPAATDTSKWPLFYEFIHPEDVERVRALLLAQLRDRSRPSATRLHEPADYRVRKADGTYLWVQAEAVSLTGEDGRTLRYICSFIDISQRKQQEIELSDRVDFIRQMFDSAPIALALRDASGRYLFVNRTWERYTGTQRDDVVGGRVQDQFTAPEADEMLELDRAALGRGPDAPVEQHDFTHRGRHYLQTRTVMNDGRGRPMGVLIASIDTTEQRALARQIADRAKFVSELVDALPISVALRDPDGRYALVNRAWERYFGVQREDALGKRRRELPGWPGDPARLADADEIELLDRETIARGPDYIAQPAETLRLGRHYLITRRALFDSGGKAIGVLSAGVDMTERRAMEERLERERERLELLVRATKAGFMDWDARADRQTFSERFKEMLGYPPDADTSKWPSLFDLMHPDDREPMREAFREMLHRVSSTGERLHGPLEYRLRKADGSYLWVRGEGIAKIGPDGRTERFLTSYIDITHLRELNRALEESVRLREEVDRMSRHDLKTPLNAIIGLSRLLREEVELEPDDADVVARIEQAGLRLLGMINLSLNMFRMEQGSYPFAPKAVPLQEVFDQVARDLRAHAAAKKVTVRIDGEPCVAWAEELLCYSLFGNLVRNAIEASPEGGTVDISMSKSGGDIDVRIHNRGAVPEAIRARFFEKYATSGKSGGTGLGTYSARLMARVQLGDIEMQTGEESGTTLSVRLSAAAEAEAVARAPEPAARSLSSSVPRSILVVDDDDFSRLVVQRFIPRSSKVTVAANGRDALEAARAGAFDAIVMDLDMPIMGGLEAVARIREMEKELGRKRCTAIAASSHDDEATRKRALEAGFDAYLEKPVSPDALRRLLADFFLATEPVEIDPDLRKLVPEFLRSRRALAAELADAVERGQAEAACAIAHKLAGSFLPYGFHWAARQGKMIEQRAKDKALEGLAAEVRALREHLDTVEVRIDDAMAEAKR